MNTIAHKRLSLWVETILKRYLPQRRRQQVITWAYVPLFLILANLGLSFLRPISLTAYFPFLALMTVALSLSAKKVGMAISYLILTLTACLSYPSFLPGEKLWQMGLFFSHGVTLYIILLSRKEIEEAGQEIEMKLIQARQSAEEKEREFAEEIERLKEEAAQRQLERTLDLRRVQLLQSEIDLVTEQKESFIESARLAKQQGLDYLKELESLKSAYHHTLENLKSLELEHAQVVKMAATSEEKANAQLQQLDAINEKYSMNTRVLKQHLDEAQHLKVINGGLAEELDAAHHKIDVLARQIQVDKSSLEQAEKWSKGELEAMQEQLIKLQINQMVPKKLDIYSQGLYQQLRSQFYEKSKILSETRKELFKLQGEAFWREKEQVLAQEAIEESHLQESAMLADQMAAELSHLEIEITQLEALVSNILS